MAVDVGSSAKALMSGAADSGVGLDSQRLRERGTEKGGAPAPGMLAFLGLIEVVWIGALIYGSAQSVDFVRGLI